jgi:Protein of unknown function (DUF3341)
VSDAAFAPRRFVVAEFRGSDALLEGTRKMRDRGHVRIDTHTPYPVHGLEEVLGIRRVRIPTLVLGAALSGVALAYGMMYFLNAVDFPLNVGNRPPHSPLAFIPVTFELMVLLGGTTAFFGLFALLRLPQPYHPVFDWEAFARASVDGFFLSVEVPSGEDPSDVANDARIVGAADVKVIVEPER